MNRFHDLMHFKNPNNSDIPNINLYMDQLLEFFENVLSPLKRIDERTVLTKTMINNYVKADIIKSPEKKKYDQESIQDLIVLYHLKKAFSIQDIAHILSYLKTDSDYYQKFMTQFASAQDKLSEIIPLSEEQELLKNQQAINLLYNLTAEISVKKQLVDYLVDQLSQKKGSEDLKL